MMKQFWKALFPKKKQMELCILLLGREGEKISITEICSLLHVQRTSAYNLLKSLYELLQVHDVPLALAVFGGSVMMKRKAKSDADTKPQVATVILYLNQVTGKKYKPDSKATQKHILARFKEGFTIDDFKYVIDTKASKWMNTNMEDYLRPETLFSHKFQSYLNERPKQEPISKIEQSVINAVNTTVDWGKGE